MPNVWTDQESSQLYMFSVNQPPVFLLPQSVWVDTLSLEVKFQGRSMKGCKCMMCSC